MAISVAKKASLAVSSLPAPIGGWNARDSIANMQPADAVTMVNMFPSVSNVRLRGGYDNHVTGISGQVETLMSYNGAATRQLFAIAGGSIYDVTAAGVVGAAVVSGLTNSRWEYINVATTGGNYLYAVNGVDAPRLYDGTTWTAITGVSTPAITGVTTTTLSHITLFKNRVWFIQKDTLKAWYLPTSAVGGAANTLDLSSIARLGGTLVCLGTWTVDAGHGADDNLAFITNNGEVIVYQGTDPASATTWSLMGVWSIGSPLGKRSMLKFGGDIAILTIDGLIPMASAIQSTRLDPRVALSDKIQGAFASAASSYGSSFGWQIVFNAKNDALWVNVPVSVGSQEQYVMNTITKSWCKFTGWAANCWEISADEPYFGGNGVVGRAWDSGYIDNVSNITTATLQAFNYFESRGVEKYFTRARPALFTDGTPLVQIGINVDFDTSAVSSGLTYSPTIYGKWGTGIWDSSLWGQGLVVYADWQGVIGIGYCGAVNLATNSNGIQIEWAATDIVYQPGWAGV